MEQSTNSTCISTPEGITLYRLKVIRQGILLEIKGLKISRRRSCYAIAKEEFGLKGNKTKVLEALETLISAKEKEYFSGSAS